MTSPIHKCDSHLYTIHDLTSWTPPKAQHIVWDGVLDVGHRLEIFGDEGSWKSNLATHLAYSIARGSKWLGFKTSPANVLTVQGEMGLISVRNRNVKYCAGSETIYLQKNTPNSPSADDLDRAASRAADYSYPPNVITEVVEFLHLDEQSGINSIRRQLDIVISESPALPLVLILDPLYKMFARDLTVPYDFKRFAENIDIMLHDYNCTDKNGILRQLAIVIIHHTRKGKVDEDGVRIKQGTDESFGARMLGWWSDTVMQTTLDDKDKTKTTVDIEFTKSPRDAEGLVPELIKVRWDRSTLHPRIMLRQLPHYPEDEIELRGSDLIEKLE